MFQLVNLFYNQSFREKIKECKTGEEIYKIIEQFEYETEVDTMIWEDLNENLIVPDLEAKSSDEVFEKLGGLFIAEGYCRDTYVDALKDREKDFPTGVNMGSIGIAIPHTDKQHVIKGGVAIGVLKEPVHFFQMEQLMNQWK